MIKKICGLNFGSGREKPVGPETPPFENDSYILTDVYLPADVFGVVFYVV